MHENSSLWVLGHKIRLVDTDESYGMIEVTSPPHVSGPPPHFHKNEHEFFFIIRGALDVMSNGNWEKFSAGCFAEQPPNTIHTFINNTEDDTVWVTGWRPKGFERFFRDFGILEQESQAQEKSVSDRIIQRVAQEAEHYGMYLAD